MSVALSSMRIVVEPSMTCVSTLSIVIVFLSPSRCRSRAVLPFPSLTSNVVPLPCLVDQQNSVAVVVDAGVDFQAEIVDRRQSRRRLSWCCRR